MLAFLSFLYTRNTHPAKVFASTEHLACDALSRAIPLSYSFTYFFLSTYMTFDQVGLFLTVPYKKATFFPSCYSLALRHYLLTFQNFVPYFSQLEVELHEVSPPLLLLFSQEWRRACSGCAKYVFSK